jgi:hypothetical protein
MHEHISGPGWLPDPSSGFLVSGLNVEKLDDLVHNKFLIFRIKFPVQAEQFGKALGGILGEHLSLALPKPEIVHVEGRTDQFDYPVINHANADFQIRHIPLGHGNNRRKVRLRKFECAANLSDTLIYEGYRPIGSHNADYNESGEKLPDLSRKREKMIDKTSLYIYNCPYSRH